MLPTYKNGDKTNRHIIIIIIIIVVVVVVFQGLCLLACCGSEFIF
jgi:flagellar basal body-associated protein FliL